MVNSIMATKLNRLPVFLGQANCHLYHYAGNNPVRYVDPEGRDAGILIPFGSPKDFFEFLFHVSSWPDKIPSAIMADAYGSEVARTYLTGLSDKTNTALSQIVDSAIEKGVEYTFTGMKAVSNYGSVVAIAAYATGYFGIGVIIDGVVVACDVTLAVNDYMNSDRSDYAKMKCRVDIASTLLASYVVGPKMGKIASNSIGIGEEIFKKKLDAVISDYMGTVFDTAIGYIFE